MWQAVSRLTKVRDLTAEEVEAGSPFVGTGSRDWAQPERLGGGGSGLMAADAFSEFVLLKDAVAMTKKWQHAQKKRSTVKKVRELLKPGAPAAPAHS